MYSRHMLLQRLIKLKQLLKTQNLQATPHLLTEDQSWNLISAKLESATEAQKQQIQQKIKASTNIEKDGNGTIATVSDISIERAYTSVLNPSALIVSVRSAGKTKIVWHGAAKKGNVDSFKCQIAKLAKKSTKLGVSHD